MPGLRETLEAATPGPWEALDDEGDEPNVVPWVGITGHDGQIRAVCDDIDNHADACLIALAPELAARNLEATERLRDVREFYGHLMSEDELADHDALLARLDQLGKEQT